MTATELIFLAGQESIVLWIDGETLRVQSPRPIKDNLIDLLKASKPQIIYALTRSIKGYRCDCGNQQYKPYSFWWRDINDLPHPGYTCTKCGTRYWFV